MKPFSSALPKHFLAIWVPLILLCLFSTLVDFNLQSYQGASLKKALFLSPYGLIRNAVVWGAEIWTKAYSTPTDDLPLVQNSWGMSVYLFIALSCFTGLVLIRKGVQK